MMKKINKKDQKEVMIEILNFFDSFCRKNSIDYSLIGGSLIGAVRHKGIIPWDDDIDVILTKDNYDKFIEMFGNKKNSKYKLLNSDNSNNYYFPFLKLVDTKTYVIEPIMIDEIEDYGIFIDIFCYNNLPDDDKNREIFIKKIRFLKRLITRKKLSLNKVGLKRYIVSSIRNMISSIIGYKKLIYKFNNYCNSYNHMNTDYVISNWPTYSDEKEVQLSININEYIDVPFENMTAMIFKNYDAILKTTFGDYMKLPPKDQRVSHSLIAYWRDENEKGKK